MADINIEKIAAEKPMTEEQLRRYAIRKRISKLAIERIFKELSADELQKRMDAYARLRRKYYTPIQALDIVTAKSAKGNLMPLDLDSEVWQDAMTIHKAAMIKQATEIKKANPSYSDAYCMRKVIAEVNLVWGNKERGDIFKGIRDLYPPNTKKTGSALPQTADSMEKRARKDASEMKRQRKIEYQKMQSGMHFRII